MQQSILHHRPCRAKLADFFVIQRKLFHVLRCIVFGNHQSCNVFEALKLSILAFMLFEPVECSEHEYLAAPFITKASTRLVHSRNIHCFHFPLPQLAVAGRARISAASSRLKCSFVPRASNAPFSVKWNMLSPPHTCP